MTVKFLHIRKCEQWDGDDNMLPHQTGGLTVAYTANPDLGIFIQLAWCHPKDQFSRKIGRELAAHRLLSDGPCETLTFQQPIADTIRTWLTNWFGYQMYQGPKGQWMSPMEPGEMYNLPELG